MSMTVAGLKAAIISAQNSAYGSPPDSLGVTEQARFAGVIAQAVVSYIQANAAVSTNDTGTVTSGAGSGGTVTATGTGTVS